MALEAPIVADMRLLPLGEPEHGCQQRGAPGTRPMRRSARSRFVRAGARALPSIVLIFALLGPLGVALASSFAPLPTGPVAAVFPPWWNGAEAVASAGAAGAVIRFGALPFVVIVSAVDRPKLQAHGAWLLLDPRAVGGCSQPQS